MTVIELRMMADEHELLDASSDVRMLLDLETEQVFDLSPEFRRVLLDLEEAFAVALARTSASRVGVLRRRDSHAVRAQARVALSRARRTLVRSHRVRELS